ncbi:MAG: CidA/LrgA family protein [Beijerinckiaceae bacterium]|nr:CidA/LrgA family protein [Beijerinckiaceae bacterium]
MIAAIAGLLLCQLLGEVLVRALALPLPGPVAGMGLMFAFLSLRGRRLGEEPGKVPNQIGTVADVLLKNLSLLFIPAATGIVQYFDLLRQFGWIIAASIAVSTTAALIVTVMVFRLTAVAGAKRFARSAAQDSPAQENEAP